MKVKIWIFLGLVAAVLGCGLSWLFAPAKFLKDAVASRDKAEISRAFLDAVYSRRWKMTEVIPVLQSYLKDPNPFVRYSTAQALLTVGDRSGPTALIGLVESNERIEGFSDDVRMLAAETLAKFRETDTVAAIEGLYQRTNSGRLLRPLTTLGSNAVAAEVQAEGFFAETSAMKYYGIDGVQKFLPQIRTVFQNTRDPELKISSAWAIATMSGDSHAIGYLIQAAQPAVHAKLLGIQIQRPTQGDPWMGQIALKYLGSIRTPEAKQTLEAALDSQIPAVVEIATVNLLYNQGGSDKAVHKLAQQLRETTPPLQWMNWELTLSLAAQLSANPEISTAGQVFSQKSQDGSWQLYTVERKNWPIYNWIDNYVVKLNR